ncbi:type II secretion system secretin GspD [Thiothrix subterranea]|uniref:Type II secretion system secretin GspD n=1 Tax=Thiothrix subterranea TaxID=2735563 RepID=A0AA51MNC7_9GAMM|nr:type II secretion system secretin GspD [Thiothrix subterranea]MDQ5769550.1 type II secretion system secretin GspD [Thiothrix subterranea]QQZ29486.1 type II secretion system secretin GspD [Thiothrix subterranea]WML87133.1 type II secretion system secretin GspD [Thiothrix subterranea]
MKHKSSIVGLVSVAVLMSACTSIKGSPGYRNNIKSAGFQRSNAVKELEPAAVGLSRPVLRPADTGGIKTVGYQEDNHVTPAWDSMSAGNATSRSGKDADVELILGSQDYYRTDVKRPAAAASKRGDEAGIALNFERASIREVVKVVLGDILKETYTVEPGVEGEVTINSTDPIDRSALIPTLESLLQSQGAVLYKDDTGNYRVAARANLKGRGFMPSTGQIKPGYSMQVVTLRYIPVAEMQKILEPLASPDAFVRVDPNRNMLVLAGTSSELANLMATIKTFDVDVLKGMSVGLYRVKNVEAGVVAKNLDALFGESGNSPMAGMIKIMPIEHMNSIMIISANADYLKDMKDWVDRFDQASQTAGQQLFVYHVQNGNAEHLADMLNQIFGGKKSSSGKSALPGNNASSLAPGLEPATVGADGQPVAAEPLKTMLGDSGSGGVSINPDAEVRIVADKTNNSLMIMSTEDAYRQIQESLKRLDVMPMQVQVEASIMEVTLTDGLEYGLQWYFKNDGNAFGSNGVGGLASGSNGYMTPGGFSFSATLGAERVMGALNALARESKVRVLSSPSILVLDNQTASIKVGDQQPVFTGSLSSPNGNGTSLTTATTVQYKDTGVSLQVTPQVNSNGLVKMDIQQDITDVGEIDSATGNRSFLQRNIKSTVAVKSGETIVLGGLIRDNNTQGRNGVPGLSKVPVVGNLFSANSSGGKRTELLVLITPTAIKSQRDLVKTGEEMRERMQGLMDGDKFLPQLKGQYVD